MGSDVVGTVVDRRGLALPAKLASIVGHKGFFVQVGDALRGSQASLKQGLHLAVARR